MGQDAAREECRRSMAHYAMLGKAAGRGRKAGKAGKAVRTEKVEQPTAALVPTGP